MESPRIRRARPDESDRLSELARDAKAAWDYPAEWLDAWRAELTIARRYVSEEQVYVAELATGVAGVVALEVKGAEASLEHLWVDPAHQGSGIGSALVRHTLSLAADAGCQQVSVVSDPNAEAFYLRLGAEAAGSVPAPMPGAPRRTLPMLRFTIRQT